MGTVSVDEGRAAAALADAGWSLAAGASYCPECLGRLGSTTAQPAAFEEPPLTHGRRAVVLLSRASAVLCAITGVLVIYGAVHSLSQATSGLPAFAITRLAALLGVVVWLPIATWQFGDVLARVGLRRPCPGCGLDVPAVRRSCAACGHALRPSPDGRYRLGRRPIPPWPVMYAPIGYFAAIGLLLLLQQLFGGSSMTPLASFALVDCVLVGVALALARTVAPPKPWQFGLRETRPALAIKVGTIAFACILIADGLYLGLFGPFEVDPSGGSTVLGGPSVSAGLVMGAVVLAPVAEEFFFRGFIYATLRRGSSPLVATLLTSVAFGFAHKLSGYPVWALVMVGFAGVALCVVYERTGSIWPCIAVHAANNASMFASPTLGALVMCGMVAAMAATVQSPRGEGEAGVRWVVPGLAGAGCAALLALAGVFSVESGAPTPAQLVAQLQSGSYSGGAGEAPATGPWSASSVVVSSNGYGNESPGTVAQRSWEITRTCMNGSCSYLLTRQTSSGPLSAALLPEGDGWHADFPPEPLPCAYDQNGNEIDWQQNSSFVLRFSDGGHVAEGREHMLSQAQQCGAASAVRDWRAVAGQ
jgi:membrane protease YdiL (CAAX protease family)